VREIIHVVDMLRFCVGEYSQPVKIFCDNTSAITLFETIKTNNKVKHINICINFIRELILDGFLELHFVPTDYNVADVLTKALAIEQFEKLRDILMRGHSGIEPCFDNSVHFAFTAMSILIE
jgi:hypothetical protein